MHSLVGKGVQDILEVIWYHQWLGKVAPTTRESVMDLLIIP